MTFSLPASLTEPQRRAVTAPDPVLCVLAGAGAGKTRVLTLRVARRVHDGSAQARHTLVCTFSRKAADELRRRLWVLQVGDVLQAGTFHRTALALIRRHRADRGGPAPVLLADRRPVLADLLAGGKAGRDGAAKGPVPPATAANRLEAEIGWAKARLVTPEGYPDAAGRAGRRPGLAVDRVAALYAAYEHERRRRGVLDLDDLLWDAADLLETDGRFGAAVRWRYRHVFVDEMQDVNPAQFRLLRALLGDEPDLCVVGDPNQSVYGWNGADATLLDRLPDLLAGTRVVRLDENHRCSPQVLAVAAAALGLDGDVGSGPVGGPGPGPGGDPGAAPAPTSTRPDGPVPRFSEHRTDADEAAWVAREVWRAHRPGRRWSQIAVLARTNAQLQVLLQALTDQRVPAAVAGGAWGPASDVRPGDPGAGSGAVAGGAQAGQQMGGAQAGPEAGDPADGDAVVVTTFHRAKGLQWPVVFVTGLADGLVPAAAARSPEARAEERRLLYVALTRAEDELTCSWAAHPDTRSAESGRAPRRPSPWLAAMLGARDRSAAEQAPPDPDTAVRHLAAIRASLATGPTGTR